MSFDEVEIKFGEGALDFDGYIHYMHPLPRIPSFEEWLGYF